MKTIVAVDDNAELLENLSEILGLAGYKVYTADNGKAGLEVIAAHRPDLVICDIMMPELNGLEVLKIVSKLPSEKKIPFIFLSAVSEGIDRENIIAEQAEAYLTKPIKVHDLLNVIKARLVLEDYMHD